MIKYVLHVAFVSAVLVSNARCQDAALIDFRKHVQPILETNCLKCHGPEQAKEGLRVDDLEGLLGYVEQGDSAASALWTDYLNTDDQDHLMPPANDSQEAGLPMAERLVLKTWIDEGANGEWFVGGSADDQNVPALPTTTVGKIWSFQGLFHPASVHFPVALLSISALFVFLSFFNRDSFEPVAFHCLWIGAFSAVVACIAGWSYADHEGYSRVGFNLNQSGIDRHRWIGIFVAVLAMLVIPLARSVRRNGRIDQRILWLMASAIIALGVSLTGFQGGELTYGEDHYLKYYQELFGTSDSANTPSNDAVTDAVGQDAQSNPPDDRASSSSKTDSAQPADGAEVEASESAEISEPQAKADTTVQPSSEPEITTPETSEAEEAAPKSDESEPSAPEGQEKPETQPPTDRPESETEPTEPSSSAEGTSQ